MLNVLENEVILWTPKCCPTPSLCFFRDNAVNAKFDELYQLFFPAIEISLISVKNLSVVFMEQ